MGNKNRSENYVIRSLRKEEIELLKAKKHLGKIILLSTYFIVWVAAMITFWQTKGPVTSGVTIALKCVILPFLLLVATVIVAKNDYWGKGNWVCVAVAAITFLTIPYVIFTEEMGTATFTFRFPNFMYMVVGIIVSICGIGIGTFWRMRTFRASKK